MIALITPLVFIQLLVGWLLSAALERRKAGALGWSLPLLLIEAFLWLHLLVDDLVPDR